MGLNRLIVDHLDSVVSCSGLAGPGLCAKLPHSSQDSEMHGGYGRLYGVRVEEIRGEVLSSCHCRQRLDTVFDCRRSFRRARYQQQLRSLDGVSWSRVRESYSWIAWIGRKRRLKRSPPS